MFLDYTEEQVIIRDSIKKFVENETTRVIGVASAVFGMVLQRSLITLHGVSVPNFPWEPFLNYWPSIQEWISTLGIFSIMLLMYMWCVRYLPIFPHAEAHAHGHDEG